MILKSIPLKIRSLKGILYGCLLFLILSTTLIVVIPMINLVRNQAEAWANQQIDQVLSLLEMQVRNTVKRFYKLSDELLEMESLRYFLLEELNSSGNTELAESLSLRFQDLVHIYEDAVAIFAFDSFKTTRKQIRYVSNHRNVIFSEENPVHEQEWYLKASAADGKIVITSPHLQNFITRNYLWVVSFSRQIRNEHSGDIEGTLLIDINIDEIKEICQRNSSNIHYYFIMDAEGNIIFHPHDQLLYSGLITEPLNEIQDGSSESFQIKIDNQERIYLIRQIAVSGWKIVAVTNVRELYAPVQASVKFLLLWFVLGLAFLLFFSRFISSRILNPIKSLRDSMSKVEYGQFDNFVRVPEYNEIGVLARDFNIMLGKIQDLLELNAQENHKLRISDFKTLQSQINPHFLYNTLDSVIWMAAKNRKEDVISMVSSLSKLLRQSFASNRSLVSLEEEYEHVRQYCIIQKLRYQDQLDYFLDLPEDCKVVLVPRLILQPIIENSIYHGIKEQEGGGEIRLKSKHCGNHLEIIISDNGPGADIHELERFIESDERAHTRQSVGLKNIHDRLKILFGDEAGISFRPHLHQGLEVILTIPLESKTMISGSFF